MKEIIFEFRYVIIAIVGLAIWAFFNWGKVVEIANAGILNAKRAAKDGFLRSGREQENFAVTNFYPFLPTVVRAVISQDTFRKIVRYIYKKSADWIDNGKIDDSYKEE